MTVPSQCAAALGLVALLLARPVAAAPDPLEPGARAAAIQAIEDTIRKTYVFSELRVPLVAKLEEQRLAHRYDTSDADLFAQRITEDMRAVAHDGHLYLENDPAQYAARLSPPKSSRGVDAYYRGVAIRENSGLTELRILPGNIRYLRLTAFHWTPGLTPKAYDDAGRFLKDGDAVIVDLRENGGGDSNAADYFPKAFVKPNKGKPIYILVDGRVGSAAEAVAYGLQQERAATVVGSTTYGAANNNKKFPIPPQFVLSVSYNRPINPISKTNWEGTGVLPDMATPASKALEAAQLDALTKLSARAGVTPEALAEYRWARVEVEARLHPAPTSREELQSHVGAYGSITVRLAGDGLRLSRSDRPRWQPDVLLTPLDGEGLFSVESFDALRVRFTPTSLILLHGSDDARETFARDSAKQ